MTSTFLTGFALGVLIIFLNEHFSERRLYADEHRLFAAQVVFIVGLLSIWKLGISTNPGPLAQVIPAFIAPLSYHLIGHLMLVAKLAKETEGFWVFKTAIQRHGYIEHKKIVDNAGATRFGLILIGRSSQRGLLDTLVGSDGWSEEERLGLLRHERGHTIVGIPFILLESLAVCACANALSQNGNVLYLPMLFTLLTLLAWANELCADVFAGKYGYAFMRRVTADVPAWCYLLGGVGMNSHPPLLFRYAAYAWPITFPVGIVLGMSMYYLAGR